MRDRPKKPAAQSARNTATPRAVSSSQNHPYGRRIQNARWAIQASTPELIERRTLAHGGEAPRCPDALLVLHVVDTVGGDRQGGTIVSRDELLLGRIPDRELEVLARMAHQLCQFHVGQRRMIRVGASPRVEDLEQREAQLLLGFNVSCARGTDRGELPSLLPDRVMPDVVTSALLGVVQHGVGVVKLTESRRIPGVLVIRVEALSQQPENALNRL